MRIHAVQTGAVTVKKRQQQGSRGQGAIRLLNTMLDAEWTDPLPIYAWVIEHPEGLIVVDTGETARTSEPGYLPWWHPYFRLGMRAWVKPEQEIGPQLKAMGVSPQDVRWLIMTHLHTDHAGGLHHLPESDILVSRTEYELASSTMGRLRGYLPNRWPSWFAPRLVDMRPEPVGAFAQSYPITKAQDVHLVPTPGHTEGHLSVMVEDGDRAYFIAGDASYTERTMLDQVVDGVSLDVSVAQQTLDRILRQVRDVPTVYLPSHDPDAARRLAEKRVTRAAGERVSTPAGTWRHRQGLAAGD
jgi:glyoxylase-like metal-dependent hydrolase (beta-lactamase superfamily II)